MPQGHDKSGLMYLTPRDLQALAEEGYEEARRIEKDADRSKELRGWWDRIVQSRRDAWDLEEIARLEAIERGEPLSEEQLDALRTRLDEAPASQAGTGEVLQ